jgi:hypothetical protein
MCPKHSTRVQRAGKRSSTKTVKRERRTASTVPNREPGLQDVSTISKASSRSDLWKGEEERYGGTQYLVIPLWFGIYVRVMFKRTKQPRWGAKQGWWVIGFRLGSTQNTW